MFEIHARSHRRILSLIVAGALGVACTAIAAEPANLQFSTLTNATHLGQGDIVRSAMPLSKRIRVSVVRKLRDEARMQAFLANARAPSTPASPQMMSRAQLQSHLPTQV